MFLPKTNVGEQQQKKFQFVTNMKDTAMNFQSAGSHRNTVQSFLSLSNICKELSSLILIVPSS